MNCFECAKVNDAVPAVAVCQHCGVGLCLDHLIEDSAYPYGGPIFDCPHEIPTHKPLKAVPAGIAAASQQQDTTVR